MNGQKKHKILLIASICLIVIAIILWTYAVVTIIKVKSIFNLTHPVLFFLSIILGGVFMIVANLFLYTRLKELEKEKYRKVNMVVCPSCGSKIRKKDAFCPKCGAQRKSGKD